MSETDKNGETKTAQRTKLDRKLDVVGCGVFFIWMGIAILADVGWGVGFLGVGVIILGSLVAREYLSGSICSRPNKAGC